MTEAAGGLTGVATGGNGLGAATFRVATGALEGTGTGASSALSTAGIGKATGGSFGLVTGAGLAGSDAAGFTASAGFDLDRANAAAATNSNAPHSESTRSVRLRVGAGEAGETGGVPKMPKVLLSSPKEAALTPEPQEMRPSVTGVGEPVDKTNPRLIPYVIGGVGIASLIGSGVLFGLRQSTLSDLEDQCGPNHDACPSSAASDYSNLKLYNVTAQIALGVGVACVATSVTMLVLQRKHASSAKSGMTLLPSAPNSLAGLSWAGRF